MCVWGGGGGHVGGGADIEDDLRANEKTCPEKHVNPLPGIAHKTG